MSKVVSNVECMFFAGFYESAFSYEIDNSIEYDCENPEDWGVKLKENESLDWCDFDADYEGFHKAIADAFIESYKGYVPSFVLNISKPEIDSPRYYNYRTDEVYCDFELADDAFEQMIAFIKQNRAYFDKQLKEHHTSCDGFISFMSNKSDDWIEELSKDEPDARYISCTIGYIMKHDFKVSAYNDDSLFDVLTRETLEDYGCASEFYHLTDDAIREKVESIDGITAEDYLNSNYEK